MNIETFCEHFSTFAEAPNGVEKVRELILQLAVQGRLVPQDESDKPARHLIDAIVSQKAQLLRDKKVRNSNSHTSRNASLEVGKLPQGWSWVMLDAITEIGTGGTPPTGTKEYYVGGTVPWITSSATNSEFIERPEQFITEKAIADCGLKLYPSGSLVVALYGQGKTRGQVAQLMFDSTSNQACAMIRFFGDGLHIRDYVRLVFRKMYHELRSLAAGGAQPNLNGGMIRLMKVPLPPLAEQKRIVAKVEQLLALCDELAARQVARREARERMVGATLNRLVSVRVSAEFTEHAHRLRETFDRLFDTPTTIPQLRQAILQLAVQGQLVPQDPNDEPVEVLLERIRQVKCRLKVKSFESLHRKAKVDPPDYCPTGWRWVRFHEVIWCFRGHNPPKSDFVSSPRDGYVRFIQITDFKTDSKAVYVPLTKNLKMVQRGEIIMAAYRHIGKVSRTMNGAFNVALCKVNEIPPIDRDFVELLIGTDLVKGELLSESERGHIPSMHSDHLLSLWIPLPPLAEQKRIVAKVTELMSHCDSLESKLTQADSASSELLSAAVHQLLST